MSTPAKTDLFPLPFEVAAPALALSLGDYITDAKEQTALGNEFIFGCNGAVMCLRPEGRELVVVGFTGRHRLASVAPHIVQTAERVGCTSIRVHTQRRGELRFLNMLGLPFHLVEWRPDSNEYVLRMVLHGR
ncbi:hypothetical protein [Grimontia marina]|uniref:N-acetyltransferase domain-containing protein n=1 Tax=Grimontia marina TaxID=646534 RepID=A0A128EYX7_9GAMM|nr:hypothetical protein [Grimontia marina]CZF79465.1 hypothetical protein GMA8713_00985 [Grimontia marina]